MQLESYKQFDLVTVVYSKELDYLEIQAKSIELYVPQEYINEIIVVINDSVPCDIDPNWYGVNSNKLKIINYTDWGFKNHHLENSGHLSAGWINQQLCKLLVCQDVASEWYFVLDAKTWFVNRIHYDKLFSSEGKSNNKSVDIHANFSKAIPSINQQYGLDIQRAIGPGGVPFCFHTNTVKEMIKQITTVSNPTETFVDFFLLRAPVENTNPITEFLLYSGYVLKKYGSYKSLYVDRHDIFLYAPCNVSENDVSNFDQLLEDMKMTNCITASVHKRALAKLKLYQLKNWIDFLISKNLVQYPQK